MKKTLVFIVMLAVLTAFTLTACSRAGASSAESSSSAQTSSTVSQQASSERVSSETADSSSGGLISDIEGTVSGLMSDIMPHMSSNAGTVPASSAN